MTRKGDKILELSDSQNSRNDDIHDYECYHDNRFVEYISSYCQNKTWISQVPSITD